MEEKNISEKLSRHDLLLIIIAILLSIIIIGGTALGFYYLGSKNNTNSSANSSVPSSSNTGSENQTNPSESNNVVSTGNSGTSSDNTKQVLDSLKGDNGTYDVNKVESQLSGLLSQSGGNYSTQIELVPATEVKIVSTSGKDAVKTYLDTVNSKIQGAQTTNISESALSGLFSGDTSALNAEINKNTGIYNSLKVISTPSEASTIQRKYLTLFKTSVEVMQAEKSMVTGTSVDYAALAKAQGLVTLSKEIDSDVANIKAQYGL